MAHETKHRNQDATMISAAKQGKALTIPMKWKIGVGLLFIGLFLLGVWVLLNPQNPFTGLFRSEISDTGGRVIRGPYPTKEDFQKLRTAEVTTIVSLLDPRLPYEAVLLDRERELAQKYGIKFLNFPMASVLGQRLGDDYKSRVKAAADSIERAEGKVYLHCYLGVHRGVDVEKLLAARGVTTGQYVGRQADPLGTDVRAAEELYEKSLYSEAIAKAQPVAAKTGDHQRRAQHVLGWSHYQLKQYAEAYGIFRSILLHDASSIDGNVGLAYTAMQLGDNELAQRHFSWVVDNRPNQAAALYGLALVHVRKGDRELALHAAQRTLDIDPKHEDAQQLVERLATVKTAAQR